MSNSRVTAKCSCYSNPYDPRHTSACKKCEKIRRSELDFLNDTLVLTDEINVSKISVRHPKYTGVLIALWLSSILVGYSLSGTFSGIIVGLIGIISVILPPPSKRKKIKTFP